MDPFFGLADLSSIFGAQAAYDPMQMFSNIQPQQQCANGRCNIRRNRQQQQQTVCANGQCSLVNRNSCANGSCGISPYSYFPM